MQLQLLLIPHSEMMLKLLFLAVLALGVTRSVYEDQYDELANIYCKAKHEDAKIPEVGEALRTFVGCAKDLFDLQAIKKEIDEATPTKAFGEISKKHCAKSSQLKSCFNTMLPVVTPCMPPGVMLNVEKRASDLVDFVCDNEGAKITSFLKEDGFQCLDSQELYVNDCFNNLARNLNKVWDLHGGGATGAMAMTVEETCTIEDEMMTCLVGVLNRCSNQAPGNLANELRKKITCVKQDA